jgi:hypothetical protein
MDTWKEKILESMRNCDTLATHKYASDAINNPENIFFQGCICSQKRYRSYLPTKGNTAYYLINESTKEEFPLHDGDIISIKFGQFYLTGVLNVVGDYANLNPVLDQSTDPSSEGILLTNMSTASATLLIAAKDYQ